MIIRRETQSDYFRVKEINDNAFKQEDEYQIIEKLRDDGMILSLVAEEDNEIYGHIMFSRGIIENEEQSTDIVALGPVAVDPEKQKRGIGKQLINEGLDMIRKMEEKIVILLGHTSYYPKFGFEPAIPYGINPTFDLKDHSDAFMVLFIDENLKGKITGTMRYNRAFGV